jgi:hypothetical protein
MRYASSNRVICTWSGVARPAMLCNATWRLSANIRWMNGIASTASDAAWYRARSSSLASTDFPASIRSATESRWTATNPRRLPVAAYPLEKECRRITLRGMTAVTPWKSSTKVA